MSAAICSAVGIPARRRSGSNVRRTAGGRAANSTAYNSGNGTFNFTTAGNTGAGTITFADGLYTYDLTGTLSSTGFAMTIVENPNAAVTVQTPIATASVDAGGNGSMTYADGTVEPIWGGLIGD